MIRVKTVLALVLAAVLVGAGSTAAWALWSASATTASSVSIGKVTATVGGTSAMSTTFSSTVTSVTKPVTFTNTGTIAGTTSTTVSVASGSTALARAITVTAWPVASSSACAASTAVGGSSVSGTWSSLPSMVSKLAAGASAVWCVRSTPTSSAPASSTVTVNTNLTLTAGSWTSGVVQGGLTLTTSASAPAVTCVDHTYYIDLKWDTSTQPLATYYGAFVGSTMISVQQQGYSGAIQVAPKDVPASAATASSGPAKVDIRVLDQNGAATSTVVATGTFTLTNDNGPTIRCGS